MTGFGPVAWTASSPAVGPGWSITYGDADGRLHYCGLWYLWSAKDAAGTSLWRRQRCDLQHSHTRTSKTCHVITCVFDAALLLTK